MRQQGIAPIVQLKTSTNLATAPSQFHIKSRRNATHSLVAGRILKAKFQRPGAFCLGERLSRQSETDSASSSPHIDRNAEFAHIMIDWHVSNTDQFAACRRGSEDAVLLKVDAIHVAAESFSISFATEARAAVLGA